MKKLEHNEIEFNDASYIDPNGRVFKMGQDVYRAIFPSQKGFFMNLLNDEFYKQLEQKGKLIQSEITDLALDGYGVILKHRKLKNINYCFEWAPEMLKDAALLMLDIAIEISKHDLILQDAYPWNISFENYKPVFIDIGSITRPDKDIIWRAYNQFCNFFLFPLYLYSADLFEVARPLSLDYLSGVSDRVCAKLLPIPYKIKHPNSFFRVDLPLFWSNLAAKFKFEHKINEINKKIISNVNMKKMRTDFLNNLLNEVKSIRLPLSNSAWTKYYKKQDALPYLNQGNNKKEAVSKILNELRPKTVLDVGCNLGRYSILAAESGADVTAFDNDQACISSLYNYVRKEKINITPLIMDALNPSPAFGWCLKQFPSAISRHKSEMTFAFAIVHHMILRQWQNFERIVLLLDTFTEKWLLIEFIPKKELEGLSVQNNNFDWYSYENLILTLRKYYKRITELDSFPIGRKILLCEK